MVSEMDEQEITFQQQNGNYIFHLLPWNLLLINQQSIVDS